MSSATRADGGHIPAAPTWNCTLCGQPWPCSGKRAKLLAEYADARVSLHLLMARRLLDAAADLPALPADALHIRFLAWIGRRPESAPESPDPMASE